jgi:hypothetical protein
VTRQLLAGPRPPATAEGILDTARQLGCLQLDPTSAVARSHLLVLWSRLGPYDVADLDRLLWDHRALFEYWAHAASIVLTEDYGIHRHWMGVYADDETPASRRVRQWVEGNRVLREQIIDELERRGPLRARDILAAAARPSRPTRWSREDDVDRMLGYLVGRGDVLVAGRSGGQKLYDLAGRCLPEALPPALPVTEVVRRAAERSLRALGVATAQQIKQHFTRGCYPGLASALAALEREGRIVRVELPLPGRWLVHADDLELVDTLRDSGFDGRTTLLSPFDNLICDRARTEQLFDFRYRLEIYTPKSKRRYGFWVMPILAGDRLIGRLDLALDRRTSVLRAIAVHLEPGAPGARTAAPGVRAALRDLASFVGAVDVEVGEAPPAWRRALSA